MGFAVVAEEVRSLAQRSAQAAKDTAILIEDSIAKTTSSKSKVDQVAVTMHAITEEAGRIKVLVDGVSEGSEEQSRGIEQIGKAIVQIEKATQNAAANSEQSAAAAEQLSAQSTAMRDLIGELRTMVSGEENSSKPLALAPGNRVVPRERLRFSPAKPRAAAPPVLKTIKTPFIPKESGIVSPKLPSRPSLKDDFMDADFKEF
jgi:methyl-accepting chemotaxis protein/methyl-accepting chemotaxis protein-1 (serine sensor receptor)